MRRGGQRGNTNIRIVGKREWDRERFRERERLREIEREKENYQ